MIPGISYLIDIGHVAQQIPVAEWPTAIAA